MKSIQLKVSNMMLPEDSGKGMVKIDSRTMEKLGVDQGDIVQVQGSRKTGAMVVYTYPSAIGMELACTDKYLRENCGAEDNDIVTLKKIRPNSAKLIKMAPVENGLIFTKGMLPFAMKQALYLRPLTKDDKVRIFCGNYYNQASNSLGFEPFMGFGEAITMKITKTKPAGIVMVTEDTIMDISQIPIKEVPKPVAKTKNVPKKITLNVSGKNVKFKLLKKDINANEAKALTNKEDLFAYREKNGSLSVYRKVKNEKHTIRVQSKQTQKQNS